MVEASFGLIIVMVILRIVVLSVEALMLVSDHKGAVSATVTNCSFDFNMSLQRQSNEQWIMLLIGSAG